MSSQSAQTDSILAGVKVLGAVNDTTAKILTRDACAFIATLHRSFDAPRRQLLQRRELRQAETDKGVLPDFLPETRAIREDPVWRGADPAPGLVDRRVEITGPTDRKMVVNALNADVWTYMADFEGASSSLRVFSGLALIGAGRLELALVEQHHQRPGQPLRRHPPPD